MTPLSRLARYGWQPADPVQRPVLFVNPNSGGGRAARAGVAERARERGIEVRILRLDRSLATLVDEAVARGADALGTAGGRSMAVVVGAARANGLPFVCIPAGTRNHFAIDLGVDPHDLVGALDAFTDGVERRIDLAEVNGRLFLNNVSLGIYGDAVRREGYRNAKARTCSRRRARCSGRARPCPSCSSWTIWAANTARRRSCSCRTTRTRWSARRWPASGRHSAAADSESSSSGHRLAGRRGAPGLRPPSR
jgi:Diacylglycerol kinase catalytic domain